VSFGLLPARGAAGAARNAVPSFAALATTLVTVLLLGVFIPMVQATTGAANEVRSKIIINVFMKSDATQRTRTACAKIIETQTPNVEQGRVRLQGAGARAPARSRPRRLLRPAGLQPAARHLPHHARAPRTTSPRCATRWLRSRRRAARTVVDPAIDEVRDRKEDTAKILSVTRAVKLTTALLAGLLMIASVLLIANTIRLSLYARRREVEVMKLVGATDWFIRWPFVLEGVVLGATGRRLGVLLLAPSRSPSWTRLKSDFALIAAPETMNFGLPHRAPARRVDRRFGDRLWAVVARFLRVSGPLKGPR
jgi:cell division transport system permease protein